MRPHTLVAVVLAVCAPPALAAELPTAPAPPALAAELPTAPAPRPAGRSVVKLRNVAAADAADALARHFSGKGTELQIDVGARASALVLTAGPETLRAAGEVLAALDAPPKQVVVSALVLQPTEGFVKAVGLEVGARPGASVWTLTPREVHMFNGLLRAAKAKDECDVLSRPQVQVLDGQTGNVQVGDDTMGITFHATPRVGADGRVRLRAEVQTTEKAGATTTTQSVQTTAELKAGGALVARVGGALVVLTPAVVK